MTLYNVLYAAADVVPDTELGAEAPGPGGGGRGVLDYQPMVQLASLTDVRMKQFQEKSESSDFPPRQVQETSESERFPLTQ